MNEKKAETAENCKPENLTPEEMETASGGNIIDDLLLKVAQTIARPGLEKNESVYDQSYRH